jgi:hypothetical protein
MAKKKSIFQEKLQKSFARANDQQLDPTERKNRRYAQLEKIFESLSNKENRFIFYCPDIPFALSTVKVIYEFAKLAQDCGYNTIVLHDVKGYIPTWFQEQWVANDIKREYLSSRLKKGGYSKPTFDFKPTDTIIIPDGFWTVMQGFVEVKQIQKVVLALGYGGLATVEPGLDWGILGFSKVLCVSEDIMNDYKTLWPHLTYYITPYTLSIEGLESFKKPLEEKLPVIGLSIRNREYAQQLINIFYSKYPFLDLFQFKILKKLNTDDYLEALSICAIQVLIDENAGCPAQPLEATYFDVPTLQIYGRGYEEVAKQEDGQYFIEKFDLYEIADTLANFCFNWLDNPTEGIKDKSLLTSHETSFVKQELNITFKELQAGLVEKFSAIKQAVDNNKLEDATFENEEQLITNDQERSE